jgi:hypothetical protein
MDIKTLENRVVRRTKMVFGLKISHRQGQGFPLLVHTLDISYSGARIGAVRENIQPGTLLVMQHRHNRAEGCVMWSRQIDPREIQIGVSFLNHVAPFWGVDLDEGYAGVWLSASQR